MVERYKEGKLTWIDLMNPSAAEVRDIVEEFSIPPELAVDWAGKITRSYITMREDVVKIVMDFPVVKRLDTTYYPHEVKFIITPYALISIRYEEIEAIHRFKKEFEVISTLHKTKRLSAADLFIMLMRSLYSSLASKLDYLETKLQDIEIQISDGHEKQMVFEISAVTRRLILFRQAIIAHDEIYRDFKTLIEEKDLKDEIDNLTSLHNTFFHILRRNTGFLETAEELRETNSALLTTKQNEIMKVLTIMAFITFPLSLLTSTFGMNTQTTPIIGQPGDFWIIVGIMSVATVCFFVYFKYKHWI